jgi:hypothetical protein
MRLTIVGCSGSFAGPGSPASCYLVQADHEGRTWNLVIDLGNGALGALQRHIDPMDIDAVRAEPSALRSLPRPVRPLRHAQVPPTARLATPGSPSMGPRGTGERMARAYDLTRRTAWTGEFDFRGSPIVRLSGSGPSRSPAYWSTIRGRPTASGSRPTARCLAYTGDTDICEALKPLCQQRKPGPDGLGVRRRPGWSARGCTCPAAGRRGPRSTRGSAAADAHPHPRVERPRRMPCAGRRRVAR